MQLLMNAAKSMRTDFPLAEKCSKRSAWGTLAFIFIVGCSTFRAAGGKFTLSDHGFEVDLPQGWYETQSSMGGLLLTKDGLPLQLIQIERVAIANELPHTKRKFAGGMSASEAAEVEVDDLRSTAEVFNFEVLENMPVTVAGRPGYRLLCAWKSRDGLRLKRLQYGLLDRKWVYRLIYQATARHYFDYDLATFEGVRASFRLL